VIIRILGEGQYEVPESSRARLEELDAAVDHSLAAADDEWFQSALVALGAEIRSVGTLVDDTTILPSDLVVPHEGASLSEVSELLGSEEP
jgi:hypothetical protein